MAQPADTLTVYPQPRMLMLLQDWRVTPLDSPEPPEKMDPGSSLQSMPDISKIGGNHRWGCYAKSVMVLETEYDRYVPEVITVQLTKAFAVYWDGVLLGQSGDMTTVPVVSGDMVNRFSIPDTLFAPGPHDLAIVAANDFPHVLRKRRIYMGTDKSYRTVVEQSNSIYQFRNGFDLLAVLLSLAMFIGIRHLSYLYFGLHRFGYLVYTWYIHVLFNTALPMRLNDPLMLAVYLFDPLAYVFLSLFVLYNFDIPRKKLHLVLNIAIFAAIYLLTGRRYTPLIMVYSLLLSLWAVWYKRPGSIVLFIGLLFTTLDTNLPLFMRLPFKLNSFPDMIFVFAALLSISVQVRHQERALQQAQNQNLRLQSDLLKKNIQPHFLMNTLLTIISLIQTSPEKAIQLIRALADEFKIINKIAGERLIPLNKEIELCRKHLEIMGLRKSALYELDTQNLDACGEVPPMLFHTLIENGLTHAYEAFENGTFYLDCVKLPGKTSFVLKNDLPRQDEPVKMEEDNGFEEGFGIKYVKARLEESYPGNWDLTYGSEKGYWQVVITLTGARAS